MTWHCLCEFEGHQHPWYWLGLSNIIKACTIRVNMLSYPSAQLIWLQGSLQTILAKGWAFEVVQGVDLVQWCGGGGTSCSRCHLGFVVMWLLVAILDLWFHHKFKMADVSLIPTTSTLLHQIISLNFYPWEPWTLSLSCSVFPCSTLGRGSRDVGYWYPTCGPQTYPTTPR